jgi:hypothetical protein
MNGVFHGVISPATPLGLRLHVVQLRAGHLVDVVALGDDQVGEEAEVLRGAAGLAAGLGDRQSAVERLEGGQGGVAGGDDVGDPLQDPARSRAFIRGHGPDSKAADAAATAASTSACCPPPAVA